MCAMTETYYEFTESDTVIGFDGMGALDFTQPAIEMGKMQNVTPPRLGNIAKISQSYDKPTLTLRKGVARFNIYYDWTLNAVIFSPKVRHILEDALVDITDININFKDVKQPFYWGNLRYPYCFQNRADFDRCEFAIYENSSFYIEKARLEYIGANTNHVFSPEQTKVKCADVGDYLKLDKASALKLRTVYPKMLKMRFKSFPKVFQFDSSATLFRSDIVSKLMEVPDLGMFFPGPPVVVELEQ